MYGELARFLLLYRQLPVPGIGLFEVSRTPAAADIASKLIHPPAYSISLHTDQQQTAPRKLFSWLAAVLNISERDAVIRYNDFAYELKSRIQENEKFQWTGIGILSKGLAGEIRFEPSMVNHPVGAAVTAIKVLRENAEHQMRVGEDQRTSSQMLEFFTPSEEKKSYWWAAALVLLILSFIFIAWYFSVHGLSTSSAANTQKPVIGKSSSAIAPTP